MIKLVAAVLANAPVRAWPSGSEHHNRLMAKFVAFVEAGEKLTKNGLLHGDDTKNFIERYQKSLTLRLDFEPDKTRANKKVDANSAELLDGEDAAADEGSNDDPEDSSANAAPGDDLLAHLAQI